MITPSPYQYEMNVTKLILLMEEKPFSNKYLQVELTRDDFKAVSDALWHTLNKTIDGKLGNLKLRGDATVPLPDNFECFYD